MIVLQGGSICFGDKGCAEHRIAKVHCNRIAIIPAYVPTVRARPNSGSPIRQLSAPMQTLNVCSRRLL